MQRAKDFARAAADVAKATKKLTDHYELFRKQGFASPDVFDTLYAEGQRRYVETFSPYARQFLDRCDKPRVTSIEGIPPAIAIDQTAARASRCSRFAFRVRRAR